MLSFLVMGIPPILQSCVSCKKWTKWNLNDVQHIWLKPPITVLMEYSWGPTDHLHFIAMIQLWQHLWLQPIKLSVRGNSCWIFNHNKLPCVFSVNISCFISIIYSSPLLIPLPCLNICWKSMKRNSYLVSALLHIAQTHSGSTSNRRPSNPTKKSFLGNWRTQIGVHRDCTCDSGTSCLLPRLGSMCWLVGVCDKLEKECGGATRLIEFANTFACHRNTNTACIQMLCVSQTCRARHMTRHINTDIRLVRAFPLVADQFEKKEGGDYWGAQCA